MKIGKIIKKYRNGSELTLDQLSKRSQLSLGFLSRIENGEYDKGNVALETLIKLSTGLDIKTRVLLDSLNIIEPSEPDSLNIYLREKYAIKNQDDIDTIESIINRLKG